MERRTDSRRLWRCLTGFVLALGLALAGGAGPGHADQRVDSLYAVNGLKAEATAENGVIAKTTAQAEVVTAAYRRVLRRLAHPDDHDRLPELDPDNWIAAVAEYSIRAERSLSTYYAATLDVVFNRDIIHATLAGQGIPITERTAPSLLLIPLRQGADGLTGADAAWLARWRAGADPDGLVPMRVFRNSAGDQVYLDEIAEADNPALLGMMAMRYDAEYAVVITQKVDPDSRDILVSVSGFDALGRVAITTRYSNLRGLPNWAEENAISGVIRLIDARWKNAAMRGQAPEAFASVPGLATGGEVLMAQVEGRGAMLPAPVLVADIESIPGVESVLLAERAGIGVTEIAIIYDGDTGHLRAGLAVRGFSLAPYGDQWFLTPY